MSRYVLIHGAWHGAWCWRKLVAELESRGHEVEAPDLPGHGSDHTARATVNLASYTERILETLDALGAPAILVGHSLGGLSISAAAEAEPSLVEDLIYLCAFVPVNGMSINQLAARHNAESALHGSTSTGPEPGTIVVAQEMLVEAFYADCSDADIDFAQAHLVPQPTQPMLDRAELTAQRFGTVTKAYIECLADRAIPIEAQRALYTEAGIERVVTLETSHSPFLSRPRRLADAIESLR